MNSLLLFRARNTISTSPEAHAFRPSEGANPATSRGSRGARHRCRMLDTHVFNGRLSWTVRENYFSYICSCLGGASAVRSTQ